MRFAFAGAVVRSHWIWEKGRVVIALGIWRIPIARSRAGWSGTRPPADPRHPIPSAASKRDTFRTTKWPLFASVPQNSVRSAQTLACCDLAAPTLRGSNKTNAKFLLRTFGPAYNSNKINVMSRLGRSVPINSTQSSRLGKFIPA